MSKDFSDFRMWRSQDTTRMYRAVWSILPKKKTVYLLQRMRDGNELLKQIKQRLHDKRITYDEIACVRAHLKMKEKIRQKNKKK